VYFNQKQAPVVGSSGKRMYVVVPRMPGDTCTVSVVVGNDSVIYDQKFRYKISVSVTTIAGNGDKNTLQLGALDQSILYPLSLCADNEGNLFALLYNNGGTFVKINEADNSVIELARGINYKASICADANTGVIVFPSDAVRELFWSADPKEGWALRQRYIKWKEGTAVPPNPWKVTIAYCNFDNHFYIRYYNGHIVKVHTKTYEGETVYITPAGGTLGMAFHPKHPALLYMSYDHTSGEVANSICSVDVSDPEGTFQKLTGSTGHRDGELSVTQFNEPNQIFFDSDGNLYIADAYNHCIRKIDTETNMVETVLGIPGLAGVEDGGKDEARFNNPWGIAVNQEGTVYVGDYGNARIRKLAIE
jgi:hypothetical protein